jgi:hypothetical protein
MSGKAMRFLPYIAVAVGLLGLFVVVRVMHRSAPSSFVSVNGDGVFYIHWTEHRGNLTGQLEEVTAQGYPPQTKSENISFAGVRNAGNISLTFSAFFTAVTWTGIVNGQTLKLEAPDSNGIMHTLIFKAGTVDDYNKAVLAFQGKIKKEAESIRYQMEQTAEQARERMAREAELAREQAAVTKANRDLRQALSLLTSDKQRLVQNSNPDRVLKAYARDWAIMQADYQRLQTDASKRPLDCYQLNGVVGYDLNGRLSYDLNGRLGYDKNGLFGYWRNVLTSALSQAENDIQTTQQAGERLRLAAAANTTGTAAPELTAADVDEAVSAATQQVKESTSVLSKVTQETMSIDSDAESLFQRAKEYVASLTCEK